MKISPVRSSLFAVVFSGFLIPAAVRAQTGTVGGTVTDQATNQPVVAARVAVVGTTLVTQSNAQGRYVLANVRPGQVTLKVTAIGYGASSRPVRIEAGGVAAEDCALTLPQYSRDERMV